MMQISSTKESSNSQLSRYKANTFALSTHIQDILNKFLVVVPPNNPKLFATLWKARSLQSNEPLLPSP